MEVINIIFDRENVNFYVLKSSWLPMKRVLSRIEVSYMSLADNSGFFERGRNFGNRIRGGSEKSHFFH